MGDFRFPKDFYQKMVEFGSNKDDLAMHYKNSVGTIRAWIREFEGACIALQNIGKDPGDYFGKSEEEKEETPKKEEPEILQTSQKLPNKLTINKAIKYLSDQGKDVFVQDKFLDITNPEDMEEAVTSKAIKIYRKQIHRLEGEIKKQKAQTRVVVDAIKDSIVPIQYTPPQIHIEYDKTKIDEEAILHLSDFHLGKETPSFDIKIAKKRIKKLEESVLRLINIQRNAYNIKKLRIHITGDMVDGESIYGGQSHNISFGAVRQIYNLGEPVISQFIINLLLKGEFEEIEIVAVPGNHGKDGKYADKVTNWDLVLYNSIKIRTSFYPQIKWKIACFLEDGEDDKNDKYFILFDPPFLLFHGNGIRMYNQVPWYGITARILKWKALLPAMKVAQLGHFHTSFDKKIMGVQTFACASLVTDDDYTLENIGENSIAEQYLYGWNPQNQRVTWRFPVDADERPYDQRVPLLFPKTTHD